VQGRKDSCARAIFCTVIAFPDNFIAVAKYGIEWLK